MLPNAKKITKEKNTVEKLQKPNLERPARHGNLKSRINMTSHLLITQMLDLTAIIVETQSIKMFRGAIQMTAKPGSNCVIFLIAHFIKQVSDFKIKVNNSIFSSICKTIC